MHKIKGTRYIYHYHIFEDSIELFKNFSFENLSDILPIIAYTDFQTNNNLNYGKVTGNHQLLEKQSFYKEIMRYVGRNYMEGEGNYYNFLGMESFSNHKSLFLAPLVYKTHDKTILVYFKLKIFNEGIFYIEISDELDKLNFMDDYFAIIELAKEDDKVFFPIINDHQIDYEEINFIEGIKNDFVTEYWKFLVSKIENFFNQTTNHSFYTLIMVDNSMYPNPCNLNELKKLVTAPYSNNLGSHFLNDINNFEYNHFKFMGNIDRMVINLKNGKNEYSISKDTYQSDKYFFRGVNHAFIMSSLNHIYIKKSILNLLAKTTYVDSPLRKEWHNKLEKTILQGYSLKYLPSHTLRSKLDNYFIDDREFEFIQKVHLENSNIEINKQQKIVESKLNFLNIVLLILTIISLSQIIQIFTSNKSTIISIILSLGILILIVYFLLPLAKKHFQK